MADMTLSRATSAQAPARTKEELVFMVDPSGRLRRRDNVIVVVARIGLAVGLLAFWEFASGRLVSDFWVSSPTGVFYALIRLWNEGLLATAIGDTIAETAIGFVLGAALGVFLGIGLGMNKVIARIFDPFLLGLYSLPRVALIPLFILWFGIGFKMKVIFTALLVFFPIFMNTLSGIRNVDHDLIDVLRVMGASRLDAVRKVFIPSALAWVFAGLRISVPFALIGAVIAEMFSSNVGLGYLISVTANQFDTGGLFATLGVTTVLGLILDGIVRILERWLVRWQPLDK
jgi:NitT/TauT family transport system permease protein